MTEVPDWDRDDDDYVPTPEDDELLAFWSTVPEEFL